ncbi:MAG TPA: protein kinase, partial [Blastocatellia bacterium]|nr:protein kinase [Blastocatellia bacterium]
LVKKLGSGGMGEVYLARDSRLGRNVAIKLLDRRLIGDSGSRTRFLREARLASALDHPNICSIHEIGESSGHLFIAMQYIEGETLKEVIGSHPLTLDCLLSISLQVSNALAAAHAQGIIHRDIKSSNIIVTPGGQAKVLDFGLAKLLEREGDESELTHAGAVLGTPTYMSPEQARGEPADHRSDIFSLGVVMYEMATGRTPFKSKSGAETMNAVINQPHAPVEELNKEVPSELCALIDRALAKKADGRFQSIGDMKNELRRVAQIVGLQKYNSSDPLMVPCVPPPPSGRWARTRGSLTRLWQVTALCLLVFIVAGIAYLIFFRRATSLSAGDKKAIGSIAVLPFVNANAEPDAEYLAEGIPESIINNLSQLPNLKVMSRNSVFRLRGQDAQEVGQKLGVQAVLTGTVVQRGDALTISIELVDAGDNSHLWGQQYNHRLADVFAIQEEMAKQIVEKLRLKLTGAERQQLAKRPTENLKAFQYYMQGRAYAQRSTREDLLAAIRYYEKAIEEDRSYALAHTGLADAYAFLGARGYIAPIEGRRKTEEAARLALSLDENLAEAHVALGQSYVLFAPQDFPLGDRELLRAMALSPSLAAAHQYLGTSFARQGRLDESSEEILNARELDPLSPIIARQAALSYYLKRDYARALKLLREANELGPALNTTWEIGIYIQNGLFQETRAELEKAKHERKNDPVLIYSAGMVYAAQGKRAEALHIIKELDQMPGASLSQAHYIAKIYAALNEKEKAFLWLERGLDTGAIGAFFKDEPVWDAIRNDARFAPRFAALLQRMGIPS